MGAPAESVRMPRDKIILITGATRGLGRAMVNEFARLGHTVLGCGRSMREIEQLRKALPRPHDFQAVDVANEEQVRSWATSLLASHGPPDLLLNNAGVHFVPAMLKRGSGVIVNFSSGWGRSTSGDVAPYCATKWAIEGLTQSLAQELPSGLAAIPLNPGIIDTQMLRSCFGGSAASYPSPEEWAGIAVPFLLKLSPQDNGKQLTAPIRCAEA